jgi:glutamine amidotransferase
VRRKGCGIGWYGPRPGGGLVDALGLSSYERPAVYTTTSAPSHDRNLRSLAKMLETGLLFGHVRAAGPGAMVHQANTHPFCCGRYLFQHNGDVARFPKIRRALLARLRDCLFEWLSGTTDSELLFALFLNELPDVVSMQPPEVLAAALKSAMRLVVEASGGEASSLNVACTDGECVLATRFRNGPGEAPPSLYYHTGPMPGLPSWDLAPAGGLGGLGGMTANLTRDGLMVAQEPAAGAAGTQLGSSYEGGASTLLRRGSFERRKPHPRQSLLVASEPLAADGDGVLSEWRVFPPNTLLVAVPVWRGGALDGQRAHRCDLQDSAPADEVGDDAAQTPVVLLDLQFESLALLAAWQPATGLGAARSAGVIPGDPRNDAHLPPRCPPRDKATPPLPAAAVAVLEQPPADDLDFAALSFEA